MQFNFLKNLCKYLIESGYRPIQGSFESQALTECSKYIAFSRRSGTALYTVFIVRTELAENYKDIIRGYAAKLSSNFVISGGNGGGTYSGQFRNRVLLSVLITDEANEDVCRFSEINGIIGNEEFIELRWVADIKRRKLEVFGNQPRKIDNIDKMIYLSFSENTDNTATTLSKEYSDAAAKKRGKVKTVSPYGTYSLIMIMAFVFLGENMAEVMFGENIVEQMGILYPAAILDYGEYYRLMTSIFLHADLSHIAANCLSLYIFGSRTERYYGSNFFLTAFLLSGIAASVATVFFLPPTSASLGASGAIFGLQGAVLTYILVNKKTVDGFDMNLIVLFSLFGIGFGFLMPNVNNIAHVAGFLSGIVISFLYLKFGERLRGTER